MSTQKMFTPENSEVLVDQEQVDLLLKTGWSLEERDLEAEKAAAKEAKDAEKKASDEKAAADLKKRDLK